MKHHVYGKKLGRNHHQRQALFLSQFRAMFCHGAIKTTKAKAQAVCPLINQIVRLCQKGDLVSRRRLYAFFQNRRQVNHLVSVVSSAFAKKTANFTKVTPFKRRQGDNALLVKIEFTQPIDLTPPKKEPKAAKKPSPKTPPKAVSKSIKKEKSKNETKN